MSDLKAVSVVECYIQRSVDDELFLISAISVKVDIVVRI